MFPRIELPKVLACRLELPEQVLDSELITGDYICAICGDGGNLLFCDGKCMRGFHPTTEYGEDSCCESLGLTNTELLALEDTPFYCANCKYEKHQCFACGELGASDESSPEVFCCSNGTCGYFYHPHCVGELLYPGNSAAAEERIGAGGQFICPAHRCHVCGENEVTSIVELQFAECRRCPRAYHRRCLPREIIVPRDCENLIPNRVLIYCLDHEIDLRTFAPLRNHIRFPASDSDIVSGVGGIQI